MPITTGSSFSHSAFTKNAPDSCCFPFFPPVHRLPFASRVFSGGQAKSNPSHPCSKHRGRSTSLNFPCMLVPAFHRLLSDVICFPSDRSVADAVLLLQFFKPAIESVRTVPVNRTTPETAQRIRTKRHH